MDSLRNVKILSYTSLRRLNKWFAFYDIFVNFRQQFHFRLLDNDTTNICFGWKFATVQKLVADWQLIGNCVRIFTSGIPATLTSTFWKKKPYTIKHNNKCSILSYALSYIPLPWEKDIESSISPSDRLKYQKNLNWQFLIDMRSTVYT